MSADAHSTQQTQENTKHKLKTRFSQLSQFLELKVTYSNILSDKDLEKHHNTKIQLTLT